MVFLIVMFLSVILKMGILLKLFLNLPNQPMKVKLMVNVEMAKVIKKELKAKIFDLEFAPKGYALLKGNQYLAHTNHILDKNLKSQEREHSKDSSWRLEQANELLRNNKFDFNLVKKILADHKHKPFSICCHEYEKKGTVPYATLASVIVNVRKNEFYIAHGNPCKAKYKKYEF